jgi:hypothetical protein
VAVYSVISVLTTWGPPLVGGVVSQNDRGFELQFVILSSFFVLAVPMMVLGAPETNYDRTYSATAPTPATGTSYNVGQIRQNPYRAFSMAWCKVYLKHQIKPVTYRYPGRINASAILQPWRAFIAPTTLLTFLLTFLPSATLWGLGSSLSLFFSPLPFLLSPSSVAALLTGPWLLGAIVTGFFVLYTPWQTRLSPKLLTIGIAAGTALFFAGLLGFGLHLANTMMSNTTTSSSVFAQGFLDSRVSLPALGFLLGLLAAGVNILEATGRPAIRLSTGFTSSSLGLAMRNSADMDAAAVFWRALMAGVFAMGLPNAVWSWDGLRATTIGISIVQIFIAAGVAAVWWFCGESVRRLDGSVMKLIQLDMLKTSVSFFDTD